MDGRIIISNALVWSIRTDHSAVHHSAKILFQFASIGVQNCDAVQLAIKDRLKNNILPSCMGLFDVIHDQRNGKETIKIIVAGGSEKPYYLKKYGMSEKGAFSGSEVPPNR